MAQHPRLHLNKTTSLTRKLHTHKNPRRLTRSLRLLNTKATQMSTLCCRDEHVGVLVLLVVIRPTISTQPRCVCVCVCVCRTLEVPSQASARLAVADGEREPDSMRLC